jgi:hypothetical protein
MDYSNRDWIIINVSDITDEMIEKSNQTSMDTLRKSLDGNKAIFMKLQGAIEVLEELKQEKNEKTD